MNRALLNVGVLHHAATGILLVLLVAVVWAQAPVLPDVTPGQSGVTIPWKNSPEQKIQVRIRTGKEKEGEPGRMAEAKRVDDNTVGFDVPKDLQPGRYLLAVQVQGQQEAQVPGELRVLSSAVSVEAVYRPRPRPRNDGRFNFEIAGANLGPSGEDKPILEVEGRGPVVTRQCVGDQDLGPCTRTDPAAGGRKLEVVGFPADGDTKVKFLVRVGDRVSGFKELDLNRFSGWQVRFWSLGVLLVLLALIAWLVRRGLKAAAEPAQSRWAVLFLDKQTNSYSLSKFQILFWIVVTSLGYIYVFLCQTLVRGDFTTFPAVPENLPEMIGVSAGTAVAVAAATAARGSKGAGPIAPTAADFIMSGGLVVGERFQFFLWTLVAGLAFLALLFLADPIAVKQLPTVPPTLLYLTGVSAAGYVGGRLVRKPGPVIKNLAIKSVAADKSSLEFELQGEGLSRSATVKIDDRLLRADAVTLEPIPAGPEEFSTKMKLMLTKTDAVEPCLEGMHTLTLVNPDQQSASARFPLDPMTIKSVETGVSPWLVTGTNFADGTTVEQPHQNSQVVRVDATKLEVTLAPPPPKGDFTLTLVSPAGLRASAKTSVP